MRCMNLSRRWTFFAILTLFLIFNMRNSQAQSLTVPADADLNDQYFTKEMLNDEEWNDLKLFPTINPKSRPETDPTHTDDYLKLPWLQQKHQVVQLIAGLVQYRLFGIFHHQPIYYTKMYKRWTEQT